MNDLFIVIATGAASVFAYIAKKKFDAIRNRDSDREDLQGKRLANFDELMVIQQKMYDDQIERMTTLHDMDMELLTRKIDLLTLKLEECQGSLKKFMSNL